MIAGVDVGRRKDRTAVVVIDGGNVIFAGEISAARFRQQAGQLVPILRQCRLSVVDITGMGIGIGEALEDLGARVIGVTITAGQSITRNDDGGYNVGKLILMGILRAAIMDRKLMIDREKPWAIPLAHQLLQLSATQTRKSYKVEAKKGHDDLALAAALALFGSTLNV